MGSVFTKIIAGELPARFVWKDERVVAFLTIAPARPGHTLVVPREEVDHWLDADRGLMSHLMEVSRSIGQAIQEAFQPPKVALLIAGLEVPHLHVHLIPIWTLEDIDATKVDRNPRPADLDHAAEKIRGALATLGFAERTR
ncbi:MAG: hypothetical protein QOD06_2616 [Candidatus Binatota bacterium]|jgi:diadenosine tetraphosphate (Ap4A) HIT family hydrolase|nr:hypothetical protein [Candidatus Binatota bacterium]